MIKKLLITAIVLIALAAGALGYAAYNANSIINKYRPKLEKIASDALGEKVHLGNLSVSIFPRTRIVVDSLSIGQNEKKKERLELQNVSLSAKLIPLLSGTLALTELRLESPKIDIVKDSSGIRIPGVPRAKKKAGNATPLGGAKQKKEPSSIPIELNLDRLVIDDATVVYRDLDHEKEYRLTSTVDSAINIASNTATLSDFSATGAIQDTIRYNVKGGISYALDSGLLDISALKLNLLGNDINISSKLKTKESSGSVQLESKGVKLDSLGAVYEEFVPKMVNLDPHGVIKPNVSGSFAPNGIYETNGNLSFESVALQTGPVTVSDATGSIQLDAKTEGFTVTSKDISLELGGAPVTAEFEFKGDTNKATVTNYNIQAFSGALEGHTQLNFEGKSFLVKGHATGIQIPEMLAALAPKLPVRITGVVESADVQVIGALADHLMQSLEGKKTVDIRDGEILDFNLAGDVVRAITSIPYIKGSLYDTTAKEDRESLDRESTVVEKLTGSFELRDGIATTNDLYLLSDLFYLRGKGTINFDSEVDLVTTIFFNESFSERLVKSTKELKYLLNDEGELQFPLSLRGTAPKIIVIPDLEELIKLAAKGELGDRAGKYLDKALGEGSGEAAKGLTDLLGF